MIFICMVPVLISCNKVSDSNISNKDIISYCTGDIDSDGTYELIAVMTAEREKNCLQKRLMGNLLKYIKNLL